MKKIRLTETDLRNIVKRACKKVINERYSPYNEENYDDVDEYEELVSNAKDACDSYISGIRAIQKFISQHDPDASDLYNSAAGKYGDEAVTLAQKSFNRLSQILYEEEDF